MIYKGIAGADGIGIGTVLLVREPNLDYSARVFAGKDAEKQRLSDAAEAFCEKTEAMKQRMQSAVGAQQAEILSGQILMIRDPFMTSQISDFIDNGQCAEAALDAVCNMYIEMFSSVDDDLTNQRATDVRDLRTRMLKILLHADDVDLSHVPPDTVLVAKDFTPSMTAGMQKEHIVGIIAETGSKTSHSAILARSLEIPAVMSVQGACDLLQNGDTVIADGTRGEIIANPEQGIAEAYTSKRAQFLSMKHALRSFIGKPTVTADGMPLSVYANIGKPADISNVLENDAEGVGLFRTEFLFMDRAAMPSEEEQFAAYREAVGAMQGKEVIIRTLDVGGDKEIPYLHMEKEENPFLGHRAIRYCLDNPEVFETQLRAILRASAFGKMKIMLPLVTNVSEVVKAKAILERLKTDLQGEGIAFDKNIALGVMIETPSAAVIADLLAKEADFFSIGTNDLTQYTMAVDRGNSRVSALYSPYNPSVLRLIRHVIASAKLAGIPVGMCGEAASDPKMIPLLISFGLQKFSVTPSAVLSTRKTISVWSKEKADALVRSVFELSDSESIEQMLENSIQ